MRIKPKTIIETLKGYNGNAADAARELGIHRTTVWRWIRRAKTNASSYLGYLSTKKLQRKSTRPHTIHYALTREEESAIINLRKKKHSTADSSSRVSGGPR